MKPFIKRMCAALVLALVLSVVGCGTGQAGTSESTDHLSDEEVLDLATEYVKSDEIQGLLSINDLITPIAESLIDGTYDGRCDELVDAMDVCNAVVDMRDVPECLDDLHGKFTDSAHDFNESCLLFIQACGLYTAQKDYSSTFTEAVDVYSDAAEDLESAQTLYGDILRRGNDSLD